MLARRSRVDLRQWNADKAVVRQEELHLRRQQRLQKEMQASWRQADQSLRQPVLRPAGRLMTPKKSNTCAKSTGTTKSRAANADIEEREARPDGGQNTTEAYSTGMNIDYVEDRYAALALACLTRNASKETDAHWECLVSPSLSTGVDQPPKEETSITDVASPRVLPDHLAEVQKLTGHLRLQSLLTVGDWPWGDSAALYAQLYEQHCTVQRQSRALRRLQATHTANTTTSANAKHQQADHLLSRKLEWR
ncbi:UNVERIFIED_CONTAM: hypothetical protein K2H54_038096 [Gekko kuhli]